MCTMSYLDYQEENNEKQLTIKMTPTTYNWIRKEAMLNEVSMGKVIRTIIENYIEAIEKK